MPSWKKVLTFYDAEETVVNMQTRDYDKVYCTQEKAMGPEGSKCQSYFSLNLMSSGKVVLRKRQYKTLLDTLGTIGGVGGIISMVLSFVYNLINKRMRSNFIMKSIYTMQVASKISRKYTFDSDEKKKRCSCCLRLCKSKNKNSGKENVGEDSPDKNTILGESESFSNTEAYQRITQSLDILNIVKDSCYLRVLVESLMQERHKGLAPLMDIKLWRQQKLTEQERIKSSSLRSDSYLSRGTNLRVRSLKKSRKSMTVIEKYNRALNERALWLSEISRNVHERCSTSTKENTTNSSSQTNPVERLLDDIYHKNLKEAIQDDVFVENIEDKQEDCQQSVIPESPETEVRDYQPDTNSTTRPISNYNINLAQVPQEQAASHIPHRPKLSKVRLSLKPAPLNPLRIL